MAKRKDYDRALWYEIFVRGEYKVLTSLLQVATKVFDIGGYKGYFSHYCLQQNPSVEVHFFEPVPAFFEEAKRILGQHPTIVRNNVGIRKRSGFRQFFVNPHRGMQSSLYRSYLNPQGQQECFSFISLSQYCKRRSVKHVDLCKIDVEGAEWEILFSWSKTLARIFKALFVEYHILFPQRERKLEDVFSYLGKRYSVTILPHAYDRRLGYLLCTSKNLL